MSITNIITRYRSTYRRVRPADLLFLAALFFLIATITYFGFRPDYTSAEGFTTLSMPSINLTTPVTSVSPDQKVLATPDTIAGAYQPSENKTFLFGHSSTVFRNLSEVSIGDAITYQDFTYTITDITTLEKSSISMNELLKSESTPTLIIMTCAGEQIGENDFSHRLIITAK